MHGLPVGQEDNPKVLVHGFYVHPAANPTIRLNLLGNGRTDRAFYPLVQDDASIRQSTRVFEVPGGLHGRQKDGRRSSLERVVGETSP